MKTFSVLIEGTGFEILSNEGGPIRGFFVSRIIRAKNEDEARTLALSRVAQEWAEGALSDKGVTPKLEVEEVNLLGLIGRVRERDSGYVFSSGT